MKYETVNRKMKYAEFLRTINEKILSLLVVGFYDTEEQKQTVLEAFNAGYDCEPINTGVVTVRSNDFYRTCNGKNSYCGRQAGTEIHNKGNFFLLLSPTNYSFYRMEEGK